MVTRSFKVPGDTDELMRQREEINWSGSIRTFVQEMLASGGSTEAAMSVRLEQVRQDLAEARAELERLERERDRLESALEEKRQDRREVFERFEELLRDHPDPDRLGPENPAVVRQAEKLGMLPERFWERFQEWQA